MTPGVPLTRGMPPDPASGHAAILASVTKYANVDGLRASFPASSGPLVSVLTRAWVPTWTSEVVPLSTGPLDGFDDADHCVRAGARSVRSADRHLN